MGTILAIGIVAFFLFLFGFDKLFKKSDSDKDEEKLDAFFKSQKGKEILLREKMKRWDKE
jgi:hypothetical protein